MIYQETIRFRGKPRLVDAVSVLDKTFLLTNGWIRTASLKYEWGEDVEQPEEVVKGLLTVRPRVDMLKFWQRVPETEAKFAYYKEWREIAAIPITTYGHWWEKQVSPKVRNKI